MSLLAFNGKQNKVETDFSSKAWSKDRNFDILEITIFQYFCELLPVIYRGYSNFLLNMAFISSSEVENIYIS